MSDLPAPGEFYAWLVIMGMMVGLPLVVWLVSRGLAHGMRRHDARGKTTSSAADSLSRISRA